MKTPRDRRACPIDEGFEGERDELSDERVEALIGRYDPYLPKVPQSRGHGAIARKRSVSPSQSLLRSLDAALIITDHDCVDYADLVKNTRLIVDTRNVIAKLGLAEGSSNIVKA
jgi:UDP-N-acetyl-D-glucosamine dehydrogenase